MGALHRGMSAFSISLCGRVARVGPISYLPTILPAYSLTNACLLTRPQPLAVGNSADLSSSFFQVRVRVSAKGLGVG